MKSEQRVTRLLDNKPEIRLIHDGLELFMQLSHGGKFSLNTRMRYSFPYRALYTLFLVCYNKQNIQQQDREMTGLLVRIWRLMRGPLQWYALWLVHHKFIIGVSGVILDDQKRVLLLRHRYWKPDSWGLPSGYAEHKEKLEEALCRELREETGYHVQVCALLRLTSGYQLRIEASYLGNLIGGDVCLNPKEVIEAHFFAVDELPEGLLPSHRDIIALAFSKQS